MKLYADHPYWRMRQILTDALVLLWIVVFVRLGQGLYHAVDELRVVGDQVQGAGGSFAGAMSTVASGIRRAPVVGGTLRTPFESAADAGRSLKAAGAAQSHDVHVVALWAGLLLALLPIAWALARYLPSRVRWIRDATAASRLQLDAADLELFALRAVANRPLHELRRACTDPAAALAQRDFEPLARLELQALGLRA